MMHSEPSAAFDDHASSYDALRRRLVPPYDRLYDAAVETLTLARRPLRRVLDLGAGTGLLSARVAAAHPEAELVLLDGASAMLERSRANVGPRAQLVLADLRDPLPAGSWDAVVSALAIHHLDDPAKRDLFARVHAAVAPGGVFVNAEQVAGPTGLLDQRYATWHRESSLALGATPAEWAQAVQRMTLDRCATVQAQLGWLVEAGFADVDCVFKDHRFAVLAARAAG